MKPNIDMDARIKQRLHHMAVTCMKIPTGRRCGFTLLEVMLAILIIAVSFTTVLAVQQVSLQEAGEAVQTKFCTTLVERKIGEILSEGKIEEGYADGGEFQDFPGYEWQLDPVVLEDVVVTDQASETGEEPEPRRIFKLKLTVKPISAKETDFQGITIWATKLQKEDEWDGKEGEEQPPAEGTIQPPPGQQPPGQPPPSEPAPGTDSPPETQPPGEGK